MKIAGELNYKNQLSIASRKNGDTLSVIIAKAVNSISTNEKQAIYTQWLSFTVKPFYAEAKFWISIVIIIFAGLTLVISFNLVLQKRVTQKTNELQRSKETAEENEIKLRISNEEFETINEELQETNGELYKAKDKAEENYRLKTAFLLNMSHEIKTPMNAINGFSELLATPELSDEKRQNFVSIIINSSHQLQEIVENILTISALETKQEKAFSQVVCINAIITSLQAIFKTQATNRAISLYSKLHLTNQASEIYTDKTKITQILNHLISNAFKFTQAGYIEFGYNLIEDATAEMLMEFYVKDTGIGIKPEMHEKIFERFIQVETGLVRQYGGNGLGLSISKGFAELLGGKIWLESEFEKGSTFYFTIPFKPIHNTEKSQLLGSQTGDETTVLIAEDEEYNYIYISELLSGFNFKLIHAKNGKEAVELCQTSFKIDLILMDIKMPKMDGHTAALEIKLIRPSLPIIAQSAYTFEQFCANYGENPFDDYINKPIYKDKLEQKIRKFLMPTDQS